MAKPKNAGVGLSERAFEAKLAALVGRASCDVLHAALLLHELLRSKVTPLWAKAAVIAALGYLIVPLDAIPDFFPVAGLTDDLGVMVALLTTLDVFVSDDIRKRVEVRLPPQCRRTTDSPRSKPRAKREKKPSESPPPEIH